MVGKTRATTSRCYFAFLQFLSSPVVLAFGLFLLNAWICRSLFFTVYLDRFDSIEGTHVAIARWFQLHPQETQWFPSWYGGIPLQNAYPPAMHFLVGSIARLTSANVAHSYHMVAATAYCLGPVALFLMGLRLSGDRWSSLIAALLFSLTSVSAIILPEINVDMRTMFGLRRLHVLLVYGEGPHVASITLFVFALIGLDWALKSRNPASVLVCAGLLASVVLTNWLGAFALAWLAGLYLLAFSGNLVARIAGAGGIGVLAYMLAAPWVTPSTISLIGHHSQRIHGDYPFEAVHAFYGALCLGFVVGAVVLCRRLRVEPVVLMALLFSAVMAAPALVWTWGHTHLVPQPMRYHLEMEFGICLLGGFGIMFLVRRTPKWGRWGIVGGLACLAALQTINVNRFSDALIKPAQIEQTMQYQIASWMEDHLPGQRVFVAGSIRFWLNVFSDTPHIGGGFDQGITNLQVPHLIYGVQSQVADGKRAAAWLNAFGATAVVVSSDESSEPYRDFADPEKFAADFPELWSNGNDTIYALPVQHDPLVRVVPREAVIDSLEDHYMSVDKIVEFMESVNNSDDTELVWQTAEQIQVAANVPSGHVLSLAISYHPGWSAVLDGEPIAVSEDALGLILIEPTRSGPCKLELSYDGGREMQWAKAARATGLSVMLIWEVVRRVRRRRAKQLA